MLRQRRLLIAQIDQETASLLAAATSIRERAGIRELRSMRVYDIPSLCHGERYMLGPTRGEWQFEVLMAYYDEVFSTVEDRWFWGRVWSLIINSFQAKHVCSGNEGQALWSNNNGVNHCDWSAPPIPCCLHGQGIHVCVVDREFVVSGIEVKIWLSTHVSSTTSEGVITILEMVTTSGRL